MARRGVPERTALAACDFESTSAIESSHSADAGLVVLAGRPGVGKSVAAALMAFRESRGNCQCLRWVQSGELARGFSYDADAFGELARVWVLVIDDLGVEYVDDKGRFLSTLEELLSKRHAKMRRTIITTNITDKATFVARYGERLASRIAEDGAFMICAGPDMRKVSKRAQPSPCATIQPPRHRTATELENVQQAQDGAHTRDVAGLVSALAEKKGIR